MAIFGKKDRESIEKNGGSFQPKKFTEKDIALAQGLVREIMTQEANGFFFIIKNSREGKNHQKAEGMASIHNTNRATMLDTIFHTLKMDDSDITRYVLMRKIDGDSIVRDNHKH